MAYEIEYNDAMTTMLELIWGVGFMAPGGEGNIARLVEGLEIRDRRILDIGCGIGGPAFVLASNYGAHVVGADIEPAHEMNGSDGPVPCCADLRRELSSGPPRVALSFFASERELRRLAAGHF